MMTFRAKASGIVYAVGRAARQASSHAVSQASNHATNVAVGFMAISLIASSAGAQQLDPPIDARVKANEAGAESQKRVEGIASATDTLIAEFRLTNKKIESLNIFNNQLGQVIASQDEELASLQRQIDGVEEVGRAVTPLMLKMIEALDNFVALDVPFLLEERKNRVNGLRVLMRQSDVAEPERYRRILEAYQIESDYGRTIDANAGVIRKDGIDVPVDFLRIGRIGLMYKTRDASEYGAWNQDTKQYETLESSDYANWIDEGLRVAKKQSAPQLIRVPLPQPKSGGNS